MIYIYIYHIYITYIQQITIHYNTSYKTFYKTRYELTNHGISRSSTCNTKQKMGDPQQCSFVSWKIQREVDDN